MRPTLKAPVQRDINAQFVPLFAPLPLDLVHHALHSVLAPFRDLAKGSLNSEAMKTHKARPGSLGSRLSRKGLPDPTPTVTRLVWVMAGGRCSFVDCRGELVE